MPATTKTDLLDIAQNEFAKLEKIISKLTGEQTLTKDADGTSIKDVIAHRAHWIDLFLGWYTDGQAGKEVFFPAKGYKWNELKRYNADLRAKQKDMDWDRACRTLRTRHKKLCAFMEKCSDTELYGGPMKGSKNDWTPGRWAEASGPSHYRSRRKLHTLECVSNDFDDRISVRFSALVGGHV